MMGSLMYNESIMQNIDPKLQQLVNAKIIECQDKILELYGKYVPVYGIIYNLDGTTGGLADYTRKTIYLNPTFLKNHTDDYVNQTVVHEFAHLANDVLFPHDLSLASGKRKSHGKNWKSLMINLGVEPRIHHHYNIEHVHAKKKYRNYMCTCCNADIKVSQIRHRRIMEGIQYIHNQCNAPIIFVGP